jgi:hypothetical protein
VRAEGVGILRCLVVLAMVPMGLLPLPLLMRAQSTSPHVSGAAPNQRKWNNVPPPDKSAYRSQKSTPAPRRDLSGIWDAISEGGTQAKGVLEYPALFKDRPQDDLGGQPDESNILRPLSYTAAGLAALKTHKTTVGVRAVEPEVTNDPVHICDPEGFPRMELFEFKIAQIVQTKNQVILINQFNSRARTIWTDGRALPSPKDVEPRWYGYSTGRWVDDYTFVAETVGMDERTWLDHAGRPHSSELKVEEQFHRVDSDRLELTLIIDDPKFYTQPWMALNKFLLHRLPGDFDRMEVFCSPSENAEYNGVVTAPLSEGTPEKK